MKNIKILVFNQSELSYLSHHKKIKILHYLCFSFDKYIGEKYQYDPDFKGPKTRRSPTDLYWLVGFLVFMTIWLSFGISGKLFRF